MVGPNLEVVAATEDHSVESGVYFLFEEDCGLVYVGMSIDVRYRMTQHQWAGRKFADYGAVYVPCDLMPAVEIAYIDALRPPLNRKLDRPPYPDLHARMVRDILACWEPGPLQ